MLKQKATEQPSACVPRNNPKFAVLSCEGTEQNRDPAQESATDSLVCNSKEIQQKTPTQIVFGFKGCPQSDPKCFWAETVITSCPKLKHTSETINTYFLQFLLLEHSPSFLFSSFPTLFPPAAIYRCLFL